MITKEEIEQITYIRSLLPHKNATQEDINYVLCIKRKARAIEQECADILNIIKGESE